MTEIQKADPATRKKAIYLLLAGLGAGALLLAAATVFEAFWQGLIERHADWIVAHPVVGLVTGGVLALPLLPLGVWLLRLGRRVRKASRFPPPDHPVIRDTPVVTGRRARMTGFLLQMQAIALLIIALAMPLLLWAVLDSLA